MYRKAYLLGFLCLILVVLGGCMTGGSPSPLSRSLFSDMVYLEPSHSARVSSYDRTGGNKDWVIVDKGQTVDLAKIEGAGCIRHIYFTIIPTPHYLRELVLRMYWDGESAPSVEVPFGDMFGEGQERVRFFRSLMVTVNPGAESAAGVQGTIGCNVYFPMPFEKSARLTLTNESNDAVGPVWYQSEPHKPFPALLPVAERIPRADTDVHDAAFLKFGEVRRKFNRMAGIAQKQQLTAVEPDMKKCQAIINKANIDFEKSDYAAIVAESDEALAILNKLLEQYGKK